MLRNERLTRDGQPREVCPTRRWTIRGGGRVEGAARMTGCRRRRRQPHLFPGTSFTVTTHTHTARPLALALALLMPRVSLSFSRGVARASLALLPPPRVCVWRSFPDPTFRCATLSSISAALASTMLLGTQLRCNHATHRLPWTRYSTRSAWLTRMHGSASRPIPPSGAHGWARTTRRHMRSSPRDSTSLARDAAEIQPNTAEI